MDAGLMLLIFNAFNSKSFWATIGAYLMNGSCSWASSTGASQTSSQFYVTAFCQKQTLGIISRNVHCGGPGGHPQNHVSCFIHRFERAAAQAISKPLVGRLPRVTTVRPRSAVVCQPLYWQTLRDLSVFWGFFFFFFKCVVWNHQLMFFGEQMVWRWATVTRAEIIGQMFALIGGKFKLIHDFRSW